MPHRSWLVRVARLLPRQELKASFQRTLHHDGVFVLVDSHAGVLLAGGVPTVTLPVHYGIPRRGIEAPGQEPPTRCASEAIRDGRTPNAQCSIPIAKCRDASTPLRRARAEQAGVGNSRPVPPQGAGLGQCGGGNFGMSPTDERTSILHPCFSFIRGILTGREVSDWQPVGLASRARALPVRQAGRSTVPRCTWGRSRV